MPGQALARRQRLSPSPNRNQRRMKTNKTGIAVARQQERENGFSLTDLHDYRLSYPSSAVIPTITQSGMIGPLLERQRHRWIRLARRRASRRRMLSTARGAVLWIWHFLTARSSGLELNPSPRTSVR